jgi:hypothetical protein
MIKYDSDMIVASACTSISSIAWAAADAVYTMGTPGEFQRPPFNFAP